MSLPCPACWSWAARQAATCELWVQSRDGEPNSSPAAGTLLWWLYCGSPLPGLLLFLSNNGTASGREASALSPGSLPAAPPNTHPSTTTFSGHSGYRGRACLPSQAPHNSRGLSGCLVLRGPRQPLQEPDALVPGDFCVPKSGLLPGSTGLGHAGMWQHIFYTVLSPTGYMGLPGDPIQLIRLWAHILILVRVLTS